MMMISMNIPQLTPNAVRKDRKRLRLKELYISFKSSKDSKLHFPTATHFMLRLTYRFQRLISFINSKCRSYLKIKLQKTKLLFCDVFFILRCPNMLHVDISSLQLTRDIEMIKQQYLKP